jgi:hypothetical protein
LTLVLEYDTNAQGQSGLVGSNRKKSRSDGLEKIPPGEDGMDFEKDHFDDENELSPLEDEELGGDADEVVETEEEEMVIAEEPGEEPAAPPARPAPKPAGKTPAKKKAGKKAKKVAKRKPAKKRAAKKAKKAAKKKKRR